MGEIVVARSRKSRRTRRHNIRPIGKRIVIAVEGRETERKYFDRLRQEPYNYPITLAPRDWDRTEPDEILSDLLKYSSQQENAKKKLDQYWIVIDHDDREDHELEQVIRKANSERVFVADSNPCFEVWLFQHYSSLWKIKGLAGDAAERGCSRIIRELKKNKYDPNYDKSRYVVVKYLNMLEDAIRNSQQDDLIEEELRAQFAGSRVYKLAQSIIDSAT